MSSDWQSSPPAREYSVDELMVTTMADLFQDDDQVCNGMASFIPVAAFMLARLTHAPGLIWLASAAGLDPRPGRVPASTLEAPLWSDSVMYLEQYGDFWNYALNGRWIQKFCVGAAQLDQYGNANNSVIGDDFDAPKVRLPDFISAAGYLEGGEARKRLGLKGGPQMVISNLAVMDFEPQSKKMRLKSLHPGVNVEEIRQATGFELVMPVGAIPETKPPSKAQVELIREVIDPDEMRKRGFRTN